MSHDGALIPCLIIMRSNAAAPIEQSVQMLANLGHWWRHAGTALE